MREEWIPLHWYIGDETSRKFPTKGQLENFVWFLRFWVLINLNDRDGQVKCTKALQVEGRKWLLLGHKWHQTASNWKLLYLTILWTAPVLDKFSVPVHHHLLVYVLQALKQLLEKILQSFEGILDIWFLPVGIITPVSCSTSWKVEWMEQTLWNTPLPHMKPVLGAGFSQAAAISNVFQKIATSRKLTVSQKSASKHWLRRFSIASWFNSSRRHWPKSLHDQDNLWGSFHYLSSTKHRKPEWLAEGVGRLWISWIS